jgi:hypothetical protein
MDDSKLQSNSNGENKNAMKNIGNFFIAGVGITLAMGIVGVFLYFKKKFLIISKIITSLE